MSQKKGSVARGFGWMLLISILLSWWLPVIGPFIAGLVGGKKSGGVGYGIMAALLPAVLLSLFVMFMSSFLFVIPVAGPMLLAATGGTVFVLVLLESGPLLLGAIIGGLIA